MNGGRQRTRLDWHVVQVAVHFSFASNNRRAPRATPRARIDESPTVDSILESRTERIPTRKNPFRSRLVPPRRTTPRARRAIAHFARALDGVSLPLVA